MEKTYLSADEQLLDAFRLAAAIYRSGFRPGLLVGVWRGGTPVAIAVQEYFDYRQSACDHAPIRCTSYTGIGRQSGRVAVQGLDYVIEHSNVDTNLLIVDDVFDTGLSVQAILEELRRLAGPRLPRDIRTAMPWYKPANNLTRLEPDYYLHTTERWLVFPHELCGLSDEEIQTNKGAIAAVLDAPEA